MEYLKIGLQVIAALGILNVWLIRPKKNTAFRGGGATDMKGEFAAYGLPGAAVPVIGTLKVLCALGLLVGIFYAPLVVPSASVLGFLMLGAFLLHLKVKDPFSRSVPSLLVLAMCIAIIAL